MNAPVNSNLPIPASSPVTPMVTRSAVPDLSTYGEYKPYLRNDFFYSCAYCTMNEAEATAIRFAIDHYEPQSLRQDLIVAYSNLMYACEECNTRKGDLSPPAEARKNGVRFFRPDVDIYGEHFYLNRHAGAAATLYGRTPIGEFSIDCLDLNRAALRRLRDIRASIFECNSFVAHGIAGLRDFPIDRLPTNIKAKAANAIRQAVALIDSVEDQVDDLLRSYARSELIDPEGPEKEEREKERAEKMKAFKSIYPGVWRGRKPKRNAIGG